MVRRRLPKPRGCLSGDSVVLPTCRQDTQEDEKGKIAEEDANHGQETPRPGAAFLVIQLYLYVDKTQKKRGRRGQGKKRRRREEGHERRRKACYPWSGSGHPSCGAAIQGSVYMQTSPTRIGEGENRRRGC